MERYVTEGRVGVIISPDYGSCWSAHTGEGEFLCMDKTLVEMCISNVDVEEVEQYCNDMIGEADTPYMGGWITAEVVFVQQGTEFIIEEYEGAERVTSSEPYVA